MTNQPIARPTGVTILAVLAAIGGVFGLFGGLLAVTVGGIVGAAGGGILGGLVGIFGLLLLLLGGVELAFAYGAWTLKPWAWTLGIVAGGLGVTLAVLNVLGGADIGSQIITVVINGIILYYLFTPQVKAAFGRT